MTRNSVRGARIAPHVPRVKEDASGARARSSELARLLACAGDGGGVGGGRRTSGGAGSGSGGGGGGDEGRVLLRGRDVRFRAVLRVERISEDAGRKDERDARDPRT